MGEPYQFTCASSGRGLCKRMARVVQRKSGSSRWMGLVRNGERAAMVRMIRVGTGRRRGSSNNLLAGDVGASVNRYRIFKCCREFKKNPLPCPLPEYRE